MIENKQSDALRTKPNCIQSCVSLADKTWFQTGGQALFFAQPTTLNALKECIEWATIHTIALFVLGKGANTLISDQGFNGLVLQLFLHDIAVCTDQQGTIVTAGAGVELSYLIAWCFERNIIGLEEFSGIPGTLGGAIYINAHYFEFLFSHFLVSATVINVTTLEVLNVDNAWFNFSYNSSRLQNSNFIVVSASFLLNKVSLEECIFAQGRSVEIIRHRVKRYPTQKTCGSFFRNFLAHELDKDQLHYAAYYLDKVGLKGVLSYGGAKVSHQHSNMIINHAQASSNDIIVLARMMQQQVYNTFGLMLQPECELIGFSDYPLLTI